MAYRTGEHESTKYTPSYLLFGRELRVPIDVQYPSPTDQNHSLGKYVTDMKNRFNSVYDMTRTNLRKAQKTMSDYYNRKVCGNPFSEGDKVWYFDPRVKQGKSPKLNRPWKGPFTVKKEISDLIYRIQLDGGRMRKVVHFNKLKKCNEAQKCNDAES